MVAGINETVILKATLEILDGNNQYITFLHTLRITEPTFNSFCVCV